MKNIKFIQQSTFVLLLVVVTCSFAQAQITLQKYDDPDLAGQVESIIFGGGSSSSRTDGTSTGKVFNIQENNPYNQLGYEVKGTAINGSKIYQIAKGQSNGRKLEGVPSEAENYSELTAISSVAVVTAGEYTVVGYELNFIGDNDFIEEGRRSTLIVLDGLGNEIFKIDDQESDYYGLALTDNGRYLAIASGEVLEHSTKSSVPWIKIYDIQSKQIYYQEQTASSYLSSHKEMILITTILDGSKRTLVLDQYDGAIYEIFNKGVFRVYGRNQIKNNGQELSFEDLNRIK